MTRTATPYINVTYFPNVPLLGAKQPRFWSSTTNVANAFYVIGATFDTLTLGAGLPDTKGTTASASEEYYGRCVSGP